MKKENPRTTEINESDQPVAVTLNDTSPELTSAIYDGFEHEFHFIDGHVVSGLIPSDRYPTKDVIKTPRPCMDTQTVVYRIVTPTGVKGYALVEMKQDNDE